MAYKVRITNSAKAELDEIVAYFVNTLCNPKAAVSLLEDFNEQKSYLYDDPYTFSLCPILSLQNKGYHRFIFKQNYIALYLIEDEENKKVVAIMHIFNAKRDTCIEYNLT